MKTKLAKSKNIDGKIACFSKGIQETLDKISATIRVETMKKPSDQCDWEPDKPSSTNGETP